MTVNVSVSGVVGKERKWRREMEVKGQPTVQRNNTEDKDQRENKHNNGIDLQSWRFVGVES